MTRFRILGVAAAAIACAAGVLASVPVWVSVAFALPLVFVLPGYAFLEAFGAWAIGGVQRLVLVPALSIAIVIVVSLLLDLTPPGLTARTWAVSLAAFAVVGCVVAYLRGGYLPARHQRVSFRIRIVDVIALVVAVGVIAGTVALARTPLTAKNAEGYTILSLVRGAGARIHVQVESGELNDTTYRLVVRVGPRLVGNREFRLEPGRHMSRTINTGDRSRPVRAMLYRGNAPQIYRRANLR